MRHIYKFFDTVKIVVKAFPKFIKIAIVLSFVLELLFLLIEEVSFEEFWNFTVTTGLCLLGYIAVMHFQRILNEKNFFDIMNLFGGNDE